jgi:LysM repeat protein
VSATPTATVASGSYVVQLGDTLTAIAERDGTTVDALAALNGLNPDGVLPAGTALVLPEPGTGTSVATSESATASTAGSVSQRYASNTAGSSASGGP